MPYLEATASISFCFAVGNVLTSKLSLTLAFSRIIIFSVCYGQQDGQTTRRHPIDGKDRASSASRGQKKAKRKLTSVKSPPLLMISIRRRYTDGLGVLRRNCFVSGSVSRGCAENYSRNSCRHECTRHRRILHAVTTA